MHKDFESFLSEVNKAFDFLCKVYEVFSPDKNTDDENIDPRDLIRSQNVVIMDSEFRPKQSSTIIYDELLFSKDNSLDSKFFKKIFSDPKIKTRINIKHDLSKGYGFYNLCIDLMSYLMLTWSKPLLMNTLDHLVFENECDETDLQSVQKNFLVNFSSSIIYVTSFNIFVFHQSLGELVEKYQEGERLTNINLKRDIDLSKILTVGDLYDLLQVFETYGGGNKIYEVRDAYNFTGQHVRILIEQLAYIEEYSYYIVKSNINHFYLQCLLCKVFKILTSCCRHWILLL